MTRRLLLRISGGHVRAELQADGKASWAAEAAFTTADELEQAIAQLAGELPPGRRRHADVLLLPPMVQARRLTDVPPVRSQRALDGIIANQANRYFRRNSHPLVTSARRVRPGCWLGRAKPSPVAAAAVEQQWLDAIGSGLDAAGLDEGFISAGPEPGGPEFRSRNAMLFHARRTRRQILNLTVMALVLWSAAAVTFIARARQVKATLVSQIARLQEPASAAASARRALEQAQEALDSVSLSRRSTIHALSTIAALSAAIPDSAFLTSLEWSAAEGGAGAGSLTGAGRHAVNVIAALERAGMPQPRMEGAPVVDMSGAEPRERFLIRFGAALEAGQ